MRIGIDVGGTFTDLIFVSNYNMNIKKLKVPSTPTNPEIGVLNGIKKLGVDLSKIETIIHGSTVATNAVLERRGVRVALITTKGFKDILEIQREDRENIYELFYKKPEALVSRDMVFELEERIDANGEIVKPLNKDEIQKVIYWLSKEKIKSIAVSFIHSYMNPLHEEEIEKAIKKKLDNCYVNTSSTVIPEFREYERTSTVVVNAYVSPVIERYVNNLERELRSLGFKGDFYIMQSNGGMLPCASAGQHACRTLLSGPAGGVIGAINVAQHAGVKDIISFDVGGTSADVSLVTNGEAKITTSRKIDNLPINVPMIDIETIASGGGSIAWVDEGGMLRVGPESAGADPGPACYGKGGIQPTITDAFVVLGLLRKNKFIGGDIKLDKDRAINAIKNIAKKCGKSCFEVAEGIILIANNNMTQAIRLISIERGYDPRKFTLIPFGGAGSLHAAYVAEKLGIKTILIPPNSGLLSAYGLLAANFKRDYVQSRLSLLEDTNISEIFKIYENLKSKAVTEIQTYSIPINDCSYMFSIDICYYGQAYFVNVPIDISSLLKEGKEQIKSEFYKIYKNRYGYFSSSEKVQLNNYRLSVSYSRRSGSFFANTKEGENKISNESNYEMRKFEDNIILQGKNQKCTFIKERESINYGTKLNGPVIIEDLDSTIFIPPQWSATKDKYENIIVRREEK